MSRLFNGSTDLMTFAPIDWAYGTLLIVAKIVTTNDFTWLSLIEGENSGGGTNYAMGRRNSGDLYYSNQSSISWATAIDDSDGWAIYAITKATGSVAATSHKVIISSGTRTSNAQGAMSDSSAITGGRIKIGGDDDPANIKIAAVAIFNGTVLTGTQLDGIASAKTTAAIAALSPTELWDDSNGISTGLIASTARTAISGTSSDADNPSGWVYGLGGGTTQVTKTSRVAYNVAAQVTKTTRVSYGVRAQIIKTSRLAYSVTQQATKTTRILYRVAAQVAKATKIVYDVQQNATQVTKTTRVAYAVAAQIVKASRISYGVSTQLAKATRVAYQVQAQVAKTTRVSYGVQAQATKTTRITYNVVGAVSKPTRIVYVVSTPSAAPAEPHRPLVGVGF